MSVGGKLWLLTSVIGQLQYVRMFLVIFQLSHDIIGHEDL